MDYSVTACHETFSIPTYPVGTPEKHPLFFEKRVYQGSSGKVYPVPFVDKLEPVAEPIPVDYRSVRLENEWVRLVLLPEIGGRIFIGQDKANGDYDFFYRQQVIKPALVGLAGPWISGGVEFNWPQHHRPGTFMPTDVHIEREPDGAATVWMGDHDPLHRMKGMHGIRLRPGSARVELRARLYNRTPLTRTFLWWANVAARVHDRYMSFFPPDVHYVADHAVRAMSSFPMAENDYYGIDYAARSGANDLRWYQNIPVPTSYMVCETDFDFFGGYDFAADGGFVHVADRHISPGKKQWTWGNAAFGRAWDRELTDPSPETGLADPYVELMAGVYTDNQPDFSYLAPYETKTFRQSWWPYQGIGPVQRANERLAARLEVESDGRIHLGLAAPERIGGLRLRLERGDKVLLETEGIEVAPDRPWVGAPPPFDGNHPSELRLLVIDGTGAVALDYRPPDLSGRARNRPVATEPPAPEAIQSVDELYLTGEHLEQYRHPTRAPEPYWREAIRRDGGDARARIALGRKALDRGCFAEAAAHLREAAERLTFRQPNPETGEAHYFLGVALRFQGDEAGARAALAKATWNFAWRAAAHYELAALEACAGRPETALEQLDEALAHNARNNKAWVLCALLLRRLGRSDEAARELETLLAADPLDHWARCERAVHDGVSPAPENARNDAQTILDVAFDYASAGAWEEAVTVLRAHHDRPTEDAPVPNPLRRTVLTQYALAWLLEGSGGDEEAVEAELASARAVPPDHCFPSRLEEQLVLEWALAQGGADRNAAYGLGNFCYDRKRHEDAISYWERARDADPAHAGTHRNLGIAYWNVRGDRAAARASYETALTCDPRDARLVSEYDQLRAKLGDPAEERLAFLEANPEAVGERDDATVSLAALLNATDRPERALRLLENRRFHPWEGGEGKVLRQYTEACLRIGRKALAAGDAETALARFEGALDTPDNLGEKYHPLQAKADVLYWQGRALRALGREGAAAERFEEAAAEAGDFQNMAVAAYSEISYWRGLALFELGRREEAGALFAAMRDHAEAERQKPAKIDYFATSLPNLLVFEDDLESAKNEKYDQLKAHAEAGLAALHSDGNA